MSDPRERVRAANQMAAAAALEPEMRKASASILAGCRDVPRRGREVLARWIRSNIRYMWEAPGVELLQGPEETLRLGLGDCDDLAILWCALCRASGLRAYVAGVDESGAGTAFGHAVGVGAGRFYELSKDRHYGGRGHRSLVFRPRPGDAVVWWEPDPKRGRGFVRAGEQQMSCQCQESMGKDQYGGGGGDLTARDWLDAGLEFAGGVRDVVVASVTGQPAPAGRAEPQVPDWNTHYAGQQQLPVATQSDSMLPILLGVGALGLVAVLVGRK